MQVGFALRLGGQGMKRIGSMAFIISIVIMTASMASAEKVDCLACHAEKSRGKSVHAAVGMGCSVCHSAVDASSIPHKMNSSGLKGLLVKSPELCFSCHDRKAYSGGKVVHAPSSEGMCLGCHDPHSSIFTGLLLSDKICLNCHDKSGFMAKGNVHKPVAVGMCVSCHEPHQSKNGKLLKAHDPQLCFDCHGKEKFVGPVVHIPVILGKCDACHEPHQSDYRKLVRTGVTELCFSCHDKSAVLNENTHRASGGDNCVACHRSHVGKKKSLLY